MKLGLREYLFFALLVGVPLGAWWMVFRPQNERESAMRQQLEAKQAKLRDLNRTTGELGNLRAAIKSLSKGIDFFQSKLPSEREIDKVLQEVWRLADANDLITKSIRTGTRSGPNRFSQAGSAAQEQPIEMTLEGDFLGFYAFLQALENQPRIMRIHEMQLEMLNKRGAPTGRVQASLTVTIFFEQSDSKDKPCPKSKTT